MSEIAAYYWCSLVPFACSSHMLALAGGTADVCSASAKEPMDRYMTPQMHEMLGSSLRNRHFHLIQVHQPAGMLP